MDSWANTLLRPLYNSSMLIFPLALLGSAALIEGERPGLELLFLLSLKALELGLESIFERFMCALGLRMGVMAPVLRRDSICVAFSRFK